jgi:hypothetical protein
MSITVVVLDGPTELPMSSSFTLTGTGAADSPASPTSSSFFLFLSASTFRFASTNASSCCRYCSCLSSGLRPASAATIDGASVAPTGEGNGGGAWERRAAAAGGCGGGERWEWAVRRFGHLGSVGVAMVEEGRRWSSEVEERTRRRGRGGSVNAWWGRNLFTPPPLRGLKIGVGDRDE